MNRSPAFHALSGFAAIFLVLALLAGCCLTSTAVASRAAGRAGSWRMEKRRT